MKHVKFFLSVCNINYSNQKTEEEQEAESDDNEDDNKENEELVDVEEMGDFIAQYGDKLNKNNSSSVIKRATKKNKEPVEMITPELRKALGQRIILKKYNLEIFKC